LTARTAIYHDITANVSLRKGKGVKGVRMTIRISKKLVLFLLFFIIGSISIVCGVTSIHKEKSALDIGVLDKGDCTKGVYVKGYISSYLTKDIENLGDGAISAISQELTDGLMEYGFVTIPVRDNYYICVMLSDKDSVKNLYNVNPEEPMAIYIEGEIVKSPVEINYKWYEKINGIEAFDTDNIISDYVIKQVNYENKKNWIYIGLVLLFCSLLSFRTMGGIAGIVEKENNVEPCLTDAYRPSYNVENEIIIEKEHLKVLKEKNRKLKISAICRLLILPLGIFIIKDNFFWEIKLFGIVISILCLKGILKCVLNLGWKSTERTMKLFGDESISSRISRCEKTIAFLEKTKQQ
jgi:hypothetical protein